MRGTFLAPLSILLSILALPAKAQNSEMGPSAERCERPTRMMPSPEAWDYACSISKCMLGTLSERMSSAHCGRCEARPERDRRFCTVRSALIARGWSLHSIG